MADTVSLCPHCSSSIPRVNLKVVPLIDEHGGEWRGVTYSCPFCGRILNVGFDPVALNSDLLDGLKKILNIL